MLLHSQNTAATLVETVAVQLVTQLSVSIWDRSLFQEHNLIKNYILKTQLIMDRDEQMKLIVYT